MSVTTGLIIYNEKGFFVDRKLCRAEVAAVERPEQPERREVAGLEAERAHGDAVVEAASEIGLRMTRGGTYLVMEGPQFSTVAESNLYRSWGCDVIGMTNMPEAKLAREAEICYATVAMVTDYDCWHDEHTHVDVAAIIKVLYENVDKAHGLIERLAHSFPREHPACPIGSDHALDVAIITPREARDPALLAKLDAVAGRVLQKQA